MEHREPPPKEPQPRAPSPGRRSSLSIPNLRVEQLKQSSSSSRPRSSTPHHPMTVLGMHSSGSLDTPSPREAFPASDDDDDGDDDSSPPPLLSPSSVHDSPAVSMEPASRHASRSPPPGPVSDRPATHRMGGGAVVLIANLPEVFTVGYDSVSFTARHFAGVRGVPEGPHFFWVTHPNGASARNGFWIHCRPGAEDDAVHVLEWDRFYEMLSGAPSAAARAQADKMEQFHEKLAPYENPAAVGAERRAASAEPPAGSRDLSAGFRMWRLLTGSISQRVLDRVAGRQGAAWHVHTADRVRGAILLAAEMELERRFSNPVLQARELNFTFDQHARTYSAAEHGSDRSLAARDPTDFILNTMSSGVGAGLDEDVIGELQFAFITGMHLGNDACIQQWWHMVLKLFLKAYILIGKRPSLAASFLQTLAAQLVYGYEWLDGSILDQGDTNSRDLRLALIVYKRRLDEALEARTADDSNKNNNDNNNDDDDDDALAVENAFARLEAGVMALGWDIRGDYVRRGKVMLEDGEEVELEMTDLEAEDERGEWAPEIVEVDEHGRERGLVSWSD